MEQTEVLVATCTCPPVYRYADDPEPIGHQWTGTCPAHGYASDWFDKGGKAYFAAYKAWGAALQGLTQADADRIPPLPRMEDYP